MTEIQEAMAELRARVLLRFCDLEALGIVGDRATLRRRMNADGFPRPIVLSGNAIAWRSDEVFSWIESRPRGPAPQPRRVKAEHREEAAA